MSQEITKHDGSISHSRGPLTAFERETASRMVNDLHGLRVAGMFRAAVGECVGYEVVLGVLRGLSDGIEIGHDVCEGDRLRQDIYRAIDRRFVEVCKREAAENTGVEIDRGDCSGTSVGQQFGDSAGESSIASAACGGLSHEGNVGNVDGLPEERDKRCESDMNVENSLSKNYVRNRKKREKKKLKSKLTVSEQTYSSFSYCDDGVKKQLQESRASMLIAENKMKAAKAESVARHLELVKKSRVNETKFELDRQTVEEKLQKISARRLGFVDAKGMPTGKVETVVTDTGLGSYSTPSLTSGSVSPDSSISMQEVNEMKSLIERLSLEVRQLKSKLDSGERLIAQEDFDDYYVDDSLDQYAVGVDVQHRRAAFAEQKKIMSEYTVPRVEKSAVVLDLKPGVELLPGEDIDGMVKRVMKERGFENMEISL